MAETPSASEPRRSREPLWHRHSAGKTPDDSYDHEIRLVDTTRRQVSRSPAPPADELGSEPSDLEPVERRRTRLKASVRRHQNDWAYRRYQKDRCDDQEQDESIEQSGASGDRRSKDTYGTSTLRRKYGEMRDRIPTWQQKKQKEQDKKAAQYEIEILYENQRGAFFCGIPLYSHNSLLNFDPPAWQTKEFKESPVNITNAQPPDPTWTWAWKTWYVDMSHDVDEEGWEYSLSFRQGFAWHGTHPWFHSWVRRRRWLRKRIKVDPKTQTRTNDAMHEAHKLNLDYFTIHSATRESSTNRDPASTTATSQRYSAVLPSKQDEDDASSTEEIGNMPALMAALKKATVDRKKLMAVKNFVANGEEELSYLAEKIPDVMDQFVYQTSRRQVLAELQQAAARSKDKSDPAVADTNDVQSTVDDIEVKAGERKVREALDQAIRVAQTTIQDLEYWSDVKATIRDAKALNVPPPPPGGPDLAPRIGKPQPPPGESHEPAGTVIRGIPHSAGIGQEVGIARRVTLQMKEEDRHKSKDKGKQKEIEGQT